MRRQGIQVWMAAAVTAVGVALMLGMMYWESEPGAIPLALILIGGGWWFVARRGRTRG